MAAKFLAISFCALSLLQTSFAGYERFWIFSKNNTPSHQVNEAWDALSEEEQRALIKRYQNLKEIPEEQSVKLQQRMDWFTQLPEQEKVQMRDAWQQMSTTERNEMRQKMMKATTAEQRADIRDKYIKKYITESALNH